jgi:hypothetical protein
MSVSNKYSKKQRRCQLKYFFSFGGAPCLVLSILSSARWAFTISGHAGLSLKSALSLGVIGRTPMSSVKTSIMPQPKHTVTSPGFGASLPVAQVALSNTLPQVGQDDFFTIVVSMAKIPCRKMPVLLSQAFSF